MAEETEHEARQLREALAQALRELAEADKKLANVVRNRGKLATETIEDVASQRANLQQWMERVDDIATHNDGSDVKARLRAIKQIAGEAKRSGRR